MINDSVAQSNLLECILLQSLHLSEFLKMKLTIVILKHRDAEEKNNKLTSFPQFSRRLLLQLSHYMGAVSMFCLYCVAGREMY